jgi:hypothetical protein
MNKGIIFLISAIILIIILLVFFIPKGLSYLSKNVWCQKEGGDLKPYMNKYSECCPGLEKITNSSNYDELCNDKGYLGNYGVCSQCGNSNCEQWESRCNCPEDCK